MRRLLTLAALSLGIAASANAQYVFGFSNTPTLPQLILNGSNTVDATEIGWWRYETEIQQYGNNNNGQNNFSAGSNQLSTTRSYFLFTLPTGFEVTSAVFRVNSYITSTDPLFTLYDYLGTPENLIGGYLPFDGTVFNDLGTGVAFGSRQFFDFEDNIMVDISLNASALASINAARGGAWAMGGRIDADLVGIDVPPSTTVPEPSSFALMASALVAVAFSVIRRKSV